MFKEPSKSPDISSYFPCPYWWSLSAGLEDSDTEKKAIKEASKSELECIASEIIPILPETKPAINFNIIKQVFERIDNCAALFFLKSISKVFIFCPIPYNQAKSLDVLSFPSHKQISNYYFSMYF